MELFDSFTNILSLIFGGSLISIVTWRFARQKAAAEAKQAEAAAKQAEAEAEKAKAEAIKERQDYYQQMADDIAKDRDYYKADRDEQRSRLDDMEVKLRELQNEVDYNGRQIKMLLPFTCTVHGCKQRKPVTILEGEVVEEAKRTKKKGE